MNDKNDERDRAPQNLGFAVLDFGSVLGSLALAHAIVNDDETWDMVYPVISKKTENSQSSEDMREMLHDGIHDAHVTMESLGRLLPILMARLGGAAIPGTGDDDDDDGDKPVPGMYL